MNSNMCMNHFQENSEFLLPKVYITQPFSFKSNVIFDFIRSDELIKHHQL